MIRGLGVLDRTHGVRDAAGGAGEVGGVVGAANVFLIGIVGARHSAWCLVLDEVWAAYCWRGST